MGNASALKKQRRLAGVKRTPVEKKETYPKKFWEFLFYMIGTRDAEWLKEFMSDYKPPTGEILYPAEELKDLLTEEIGEILRQPRMRASHHFDKATSQGVTCQVQKGETKVRKLRVTIMEGLKISVLETGDFMGGYTYEESEEFAESLVAGFFDNMRVKKGT